MVLYSVHPAALGAARWGWVRGFVPCLARVQGSCSAAEVGAQPLLPLPLLPQPLLPLLPQPQLLLPWEAYEPV
jgi:hypothetical protein